MFVAWQLAALFDVLHCQSCVHLVLEMHSPPWPAMHAACLLALVIL
jgi:hypothetical protein